MDLEEVSWEPGLDGCGSGQGEVAGCCECGNEPLVSIKYGEFFQLLRICQLLRKDCASSRQSVMELLVMCVITWLSSVTLALCACACVCVYNPLQLFLLSRHITLYHLGSCEYKGYDGIAFPIHAIKVYRWSRGIAPLILNLGTRWRWVFTFTPQPP